MTTILRREGYCVNHKRIQRLCRDEGLRVLHTAKKRSRVGISTINSARLRATYPDHVWAIDFQFDQTTDFRTLKILNITDEFTKEALAIDVRSRAGTAYIEPGCPWENPFIESFNGKLRDELLSVEAFETVLEAQVLAEDYRIEYNTYRPHSALDQLTPIEFAERWHRNQAGLT